MFTYDDRVLSKEKLHADHIDQRRQREASERDEFLRQHYMVKNRERQIEEEDKKKNLEMLRAYELPWGRPGGSVARESNGKNLKSVGKDVHRVLADEHEELALGRPGCGAPLRTDSGRVKASLASDPAIYFQARERDQLFDVIKPNGFRTKAVTTELEVLAHQTRENRSIKQKQKKWWEEDDDTNNIYDPFGKPGAGAPLKNEAGKLAAVRTMNLKRTVVESNNDQLASLDSSPRSQKCLSRSFGEYGDSHAGAERYLEQSRGALPRYDLVGNVATTKKQNVARRPADDCDHPSAKQAPDSNTRIRQGNSATEEVIYNGTTGGLGKQVDRRLATRTDGKDAPTRSEMKGSDNSMHHLANNLWGLQAAHDMTDLDSKKLRSNTSRIF